MILSYEILLFLLKWVFVSLHNETLLIKHFWILVLPVNRIGSYFLKLQEGFKIDFAFKMYRS